MTTADHYSLPYRGETMPELCKHTDCRQCTPECDEINRKFDEWLRRKLREQFPEDHKGGS